MIKLTAVPLVFLAVSMMWATVAAAEELRRSGRSRS
jgi:hypothetical protein